MAISSPPPPASEFAHRSKRPPSDALFRIALELFVLCLVAQIWPHLLLSEKNSLPIHSVAALFRLRLVTSQFLFFLVTGRAHFKELLLARFFHQSAPLVGPTVLQ